MAFLAEISRIGIVVCSTFRKAVAVPFVTVTRCVAVSYEGKDDTQRQWG